MFQPKTAGILVLGLALIFGVTTIAHSQMGGRIAVKVVDENDQPLKGRKLTVNEARPRAERPQRGYR